MSIYVDHDPVVFVEVCGCPEFSSNAQLALSVWNWKNFLTDPSENLASGIPDWKAIATFSNITFPALATKPCR